MTDDRFDDHAPLAPELATFEARVRALPTPPEPSWSRVPAARAAARRQEQWWGAAVAIAASLLVVAAFAWNSAAGWPLATLQGPVRTEGMAWLGRLGVGGTVVTGPNALARLEVPGLGHVTLEGGCRLTRVRSKARGVVELELVHGTIEARISAPPRQFVVGTSIGRAIDLGCAYRLTVDDRDRGRLEVTEGRVLFEHEGLESRVPAGLWAPLSENGAGVPRRAYASETFLAAIAATDKVQCDSGELGAALGVAEASDAITLWHLLQRVPESQRRAVAERIATLIEVPGDVALERVLALEPAALESWWNALGVGSMADWATTAVTPGAVR